jgi:hypothetical protein
MDEKETVKHDEEELDHLKDEIDVARAHLNERTHQEEKEPYLFEDDQEEPDEKAARLPQEPEEGPGNNNVPG